MWRSRHHKRNLISQLAREAAKMRDRVPPAADQFPYGSWCPTTWSTGLKTCRDWHPRKRAGIGTRVGLVHYTKDKLLAPKAETAIITFYRL